MKLQSVTDMNARIERVFKRMESVTRVTKQYQNIARISKRYEKQMSNFQHLDRVLQHQQRIQKILNGYNRSSAPLLQQKAVLTQHEAFAKVLTANFAAQLSVDAINHIFASTSQYEDSLDSIDIDADTSLSKLELSPSKLNETYFLSWFDDLKPSMQLVVTLILSYWLNVCTNLSMPLYENWENLFELRDSRSAAKVVVAEASKDFSLNELEEYRFVVATSLNVREFSNQKSELIYSLHNGNVVKFLTRTKSWIKIEFVCADTGDVVVGWVFGRYLRKFE